MLRAVLKYRCIMALIDLILKDTVLLFTIELQDSPQSSELKIREVSMTCDAARLLFTWLTTAVWGKSSAQGNNLSASERSLHVLWNPKLERARLSWVILIPSTFKFFKIHFNIIFPSPPMPYEFFSLQDFWSDFLKSLCMRQIRSVFIPLGSTNLTV
jgi:hypothetical protein